MLVMGLSIDDGFRVLDAVNFEALHYLYIPVVEVEVEPSSTDQQCQRA